MYNKLVKTVAVALVVIVFLGAGYVFYQGQMTSKQSQTSPLQEVAPTKSEIQPQDATPMSHNGKVLAGTNTPYIDFNTKDYDEALKSNKIILLNFYANWCPICRAEQQDLFEGFNSLDFENVVAFRVNYKDSDTDTDEQALAKEFSVPYQHTKVILKDGKQVKKVTEQWNKEKLIQEMNTVVK